MGKFLFPVPARRSKQPAASPSSNTAPIPTPGPPMGLSKAHQILGGGMGNGTSILAATYRQWDDGAADYSGISANVPDNHTGMGARGTDRMRHGDDGAGNGRAAWEAESDTIPLHARKGDADPLAKCTTAADLNSAQPDDSEMLRHMPSNASLSEWYDKSKLPLSISQQTSASAMAKGLPHKASLLLDMENISPTSTTFPAKQKKKKKPHGLDLSGLWHRKRGKSIENGMLETEHDAGNAMPAPIRRGRHWRKYETAKDTQPSRPQTSESEIKKKPGDMANMERMYRHYEAATHRDNPDEENMPPPVPPLPESIRVDPVTTWTAPASQPHTPLTRPPLSRGSSRPSDVTSISSRQTRESKHTVHSTRFDADFKLRSVLSLSSSSEASGDEDDDGRDEDEMADGVEAFLLEASRGTTPIMGFADKRSNSVSSNFDDHPGDLPGGLVPSIRSNRNKRESYASTDTYLTVPSQAASKKSKSTAPSSQGSPWAAKAQSRLSIMSTSTTASSASWASAPRLAYPAPANSPPSMALPKPPPQRNKTQREGKRLASASSVACLNRPTTGRLTTSIRTSQSYQQLSPTSQGSSQSPWDDMAQPTPPLTPAAIDAFLRSANVSGTTNGHPPADMPTETPADDEPHRNPNRDSVASVYNPRFMAVTRQEELLLAALRQKRALMRESFSEYLPDQELDGVGELPAKGSKRSDSRASRAPSTAKRGTTSRSSTQTLTDKSFAGNHQPRDVLEGEVRDGGRKRGSASSHSQPASQRSSATVSRAPRDDASPITGRNNSTVSQDVPLFLDESSIPDLYRAPKRHLQSFSRPRPPPASASASATGSRSSSAMLSAAIDEIDTNEEIEDFEILDQNFEGEETDYVGDSESDGDTAFMFPVPGGRGSINVGIVSAPQSRSSSVRKASSSTRSSQKSPSRTVSMGGPPSRRGAINEAKSTIPEDEVHNATSDDMWSPMAPPPEGKERRASCDVPRPDSPPLAPDEVMRKKKTAARLSAVGGRSGEPGWWGHDG